MSMNNGIIIDIRTTHLKFLYAIQPMSTLRYIYSLSQTKLIKAEVSKKATATE